MIIADSSIWVNFLRSRDTTDSRELDLLLSNREISMTGMVITELLLGTRTDSEMENLRGRFRRLPYVETDQSTWILIGELANQLRRMGQTIPLSDVVIAAPAIQNGLAVYTLDAHFQRIPGLQLHVLDSA